MQKNIERALIVAATLTWVSTGCFSVKPEAPQVSHVRRNQVGSAAPVDNVQSSVFDPAMTYVESRAHAWIEDRKCISCHSAMPFVLARAALGGIAQNGTANEIRARASTRVSTWSTITPWYSYSDEKSAQSRGSEAVINALVLVTYDNATSGQLSSDTRKALDLMLSTQRATGGWAWLDYAMEPWESSGAQYFGAAMAAIAVGEAPAQYAQMAADPVQLARLIGFLRSAHLGGTLNLHNEIMVLWASTHLGGILSSSEQQALVDRIFANQGDDGSWSMNALGSWTDQGNPQPGGHPYATSLATLVLLESGVSPSDSRIQNAIAWLKNSFDPSAGQWHAYSVNFDSDFSHGLMTDAANAYTVMALKKAGAYY